MRRSRALAMAIILAASFVPLASGATAPDRPAVSGLVPGADLTSPAALGWTPEQAAAARGYSRGSWALGFISPLVGMAALALFSLTGLAGGIEKWIRARLSWRPASDAAFIV